MFIKLLIKSKILVLNDSLHNIFDTFRFQTVVSDILDITDNLSSELVLNFLSLLEHFARLVVLYFAFDLHLYFLSKTLSDSVLIVHKSPGGRVFAEGVGHSDRNLEVAQLLRSQRGYFNAVS